MCIYFIIEVIFLILFLLQISNHGDQRITCKEDHAYFMFALICLYGLMALRNNTVGGDTYSYSQFFVNKISIYGTLNNPNPNIEIGFVWVMRLLSKISHTVFFVIFSTSTIFILSFYLLLKKNAIYCVLPLIVYMLYWRVIQCSFTAMRQMIACSFFVYAYYIWTLPNIKCKKIIVISILILSFFTHTSMAIAIPMALVALFVPINRKNAYIIIFLAFFISQVEKLFFHELFTQFNLLFEEYDMFDRMLSYYDNDAYELKYNYTIGYLPNILYVVSLLLMANNDYEDCRDFRRNCLVLGCAIYNIGLSFPMMSRASYLLLFVGITYIPKDFFVAIRKEKCFVPLAISLIYVLYRTYVFYENPVGDSIGDRMFPYLFIFE